MEDGNTEKYHISSLMQDFIFSGRKMGCIRCIISQVYNKFPDHALVRAAPFSYAVGKA